MILNSSKIFHKILKGLNDMPLKELMAMQGYYDLLNQLAVSMVRKGETIFPYFKSVEDGSTGCTNGKSVFINTWSPMALCVESFKEILEGEDKPNWLSQLPSNINVQQYSYLVNTGLVCHEFAHVLYTDFYSLASIRKELSEGNFDSCSNKEKLGRVFNSKFKNSLVKNIKFLTNAVEDGYIENCLALEYPSNGTVVRGLQATREMLFFSSPSLYDMEDKVVKGKIDIPSLFCNLLLLQVRGFTPKDIEKCSGELHKLLLEALEKTKPYVDDYLKSSQRHREDIIAIFDIVADLYPDLKESSNENESESNKTNTSDDSDENNDDEDGDSSDENESDENDEDSDVKDSDKEASKNNDSDSDTEGNSNSDDDSSDEDSPEADNSNETESDDADDNSDEEKNNDDSNSEDSSETDGSYEENGDSSSSNEDVDETESDDAGSDTDMSEEESSENIESDSNAEKSGEENSEDSDDNSDDGDSSKIDEKSPSIKDTQTPADEEETDTGRKEMGISEDELENSSRSSLRNPTIEISEEELEDKQKEVDKAFENAKNDNSSSSNDGLNEMAKQLAEKEIAQNQCNNLTKNFKENEDYFVRSRANVVNTKQHPCKKGDQETYKKIYKELEPTIKACVRRIKQVLKKRDFDDEETGFSSGQKLVSRELYRQDRKVFSKDLVPDESPDVAFTIMVDESGSMYGEKIATARNTAILFDAVARELNIPTRIVGHDETYDIVNVYNYRNFVSNNKEKFSLVNIEARSGNIDTIVLTGLCEEMLKREEKSKVVIVISDGLPCGLDDNIIKDNFKGVPLKILNSDDVRYREDYDMQELNACVRYYRKKGIKIIGVAIDEKDGIKAIYEEGTLDCTDLKKLPIEMLKLFKKYVLK